MEALVPRERRDEVRRDGAAQHVQLPGVRVRVVRAPHVEAPPAECDAEIVARQDAPLAAAPVLKFTFTTLYLLSLSSYHISSYYTFSSTTTHILLNSYYLYYLLNYPIYDYI